MPDTGGWSIPKPVRRGKIKTPCTFRQNAQASGNAEPEIERAVPQILCKPQTMSLIGGRIDLPA